jgi:hypothetical protein
MQTLNFSEAMSVWPTAMLFCYEIFLWVYKAMDEERVTNLTLVLLCKNRFGPHITDG